MTNPYNLLVGLALLHEYQQNQQKTGVISAGAWSALTIHLASHLCLVRRDDVDEVITLDNITSVRNVEPWVVGLSYFRGQILNVINLKKFFNLPEKNYASEAPVLVVRGRNEWFGLQVDELMGVRHIWSDSTSIAASEPKDDLFGHYEHQSLQMEDELLRVLEIKRLALDFGDRTSSAYLDKGQ